MSKVEHLETAKMLRAQGELQKASMLDFRSLDMCVIKYYIICEPKNDRPKA